MKKRLITYSCFVILCSGFCNKSIASKPSFTGKNARTVKFLSPENSLHDKNARPFNAQAELEAIALTTTLSCFIGEQIFLLPLDGLHTYKTVSIPGAGQLKKDYLLHLFPSHYFW